MTWLLIAALALVLIAGIAFEVLVVERWRPTTRLGRARAYAAAGSVIVAGLTMPADFLSQASLALPLYLLCEATIQLARRLRP